jgi:hypothetical protein
MNEPLETKEMLNSIQNYPDCQDAVLCGSLWRRSYWLACDENEVWGSDPDGNEIEMSKNNFVEEYKDAKWVSDFGWKTEENNYA